MIEYLNREKENVTKREAKIAHQGFVAYNNGDRWCHWKKQCTNNAQLEAGHFSHLQWYVLLPEKESKII